MSKARMILLFIVLIPVMIPLLFIAGIEESIDTKNGLRG